MAIEKRLIDADALKCAMYSIKPIPDSEYIFIDVIIEEIDNAPTTDAVEVARIEEVKQEILQVFDNFIDKDKPLAYWSINDAWSYYSGKIQAWEVARRLVNAALTDLCGAKMDGDGNG